MRNTITLEISPLTETVKHARFANIRSLHAAGKLDDNDVKKLARESNANALLGREEGLETLEGCFEAIDFGWVF